MANAKTSAMGHSPLFEQYRPASFDEVVAQKAAVAKIKQIAKRGLGGRAYWIAGKSGTGKTTLARLIAAELADPMNIVELDAHEMQPRLLERVERTMRLSGLGKKRGRAYILNEAHGLQKHIIRRLLTTLEALPRHAAFIFTTTVRGQQGLFEAQIDAHPLLSRCIELQLDTDDLTEPFAKMAKKIAKAEGLDGQPAARYLELAERCDDNLRAMLQAVDSGEMLL